jgi:hypothetical protein
MNRKFMVAIDIKMFIVHKTRIEITILADCVIFTVDAFKARAYNRLLETKFAAIIVMCTQTICKFHHLKYFQYKSIVFYLMTFKIMNKNMRIFTFTFIHYFLIETCLAQIKIFTFQTLKPITPNWFSMAIIT